MAKEEKENKVVETEVVDAKNVETPVEEEEKRVPYYIASIDGQEQEITVGVNGKMYKIQTGHDIMIPESVREVLEHSHQQTRAIARIKAEIKDQELSY